VTELDQGGPAEEGERSAEELGTLRGVGRLACRLGQRLEPAEVIAVAADPNPVARRLCLDHVRADRLPQMRDVDLEHLGRARRRRLAPEAVDQGFHGDDTAGVEQQTREESAGLAGRERDGLAVRNRFQRPEQAEIDHRALGIIAG
jgi:hypothetical protein